MALQNGTRLGPYEILALIGAGGMGEVYRARDTRLDRGVAIKILPPAFAHDEQLRVRFEREAKAISSLANPHICTVHDVGHQDGVDFLVMELLDGESVAERLSRGPLPVDQVLRMGIEVASALDAAHRQGITHRDLKPANIMLTRSGAKLLDFGLARQQEDAGAANPGDATVQKALTDAGTVVGTFQYMAPEQVEGHVADARTDIFALGAVLYEAATGQRAFQGKSRASLIASILDYEPPPISTVRPMTPPSLDRIIRACLRKDPAERIQTAHDLMLDLTWVREGSMSGEAPVIGPRRTRKILSVAAAALLLAAAATFATLWLRSRSRIAEPVTFSILPDVSTELPIGGAEARLSPDGTRIVFPANTEGVPSLWIRSLSEAVPHRLPGTEGTTKPFWSPDGKWIAFFTAARLRKLEIASGAIQDICDTQYGVGGTWNPDGTILFAQRFNDGLYRVPASGGIPVAVTKLDRSKRESLHGWPDFLSDGRRFVFLYRTVGDERNEIRAGSLDGGPLTPLVKADSLVGFSAPWLLFVRDGNLYAQALDESKLRLTGDAQQLASGVSFEENWASAGASVSANAIAYVPTYTPRAEMHIYDRRGGDLGVATADDAIGEPAVSPDGRKLLVAKFDPKKGASDVWSIDLARGTRTRLTSGLSRNHLPLWAPDGKRFAFVSDRDGMYDVYVQDADDAATPAPLWRSDLDKEISSWSTDARWLFVQVDTPRNGYDLWSLSADGTEKKPLIATPYREIAGMISPDGRMLAFLSWRSGSQELYVRPLAGGASVQISTNGASGPTWDPRGGEILYRSDDNALMSVAVRMQGSDVEAGLAQRLFAFPAGNRGRGWTIFPDGRLLIPIVADSGHGQHIDVLLNWRARLQQ